MTIYFVRHGQTEWNAELRLQGQQDIPLNDTGRLQAARNGEMLGSLVADLAAFAFVSSPLQRARETMEILRKSAGMDVRDYAIEERLKEISFGDWEGLTTAEVAATCPARIEDRSVDKWDFLPPGDNAESYEILSWRVGSWLKDVADNTIAVCHGGIIRCVFKLTGVLSKQAAANLDIPQDRLLRFKGGQLEWI